MEFTKPTAPAAPQPRAVNDVAGPVPAQPTQQQSEPPKPDDMTVHEPAAAANDAPKDKSAPKAEAPKTAKPKVLKQKGGGTGVAIFASIVIILGLGALMTYAYLRSQNISIF